jgi:hypothetical protein
VTDKKQTEPCSPAHDWEWQGTYALPGGRRDVYDCRRCPMAKSVVSQVFESREAMFDILAAKTEQQKLADEIQMEVMRGRSS